MITTAPSRAQKHVKKPALVGLFLSVFLAMLDAQVVATALPRIAAEFGGTGAYAWVTTAYLLAGSVTAPLYGKLGDVFGRKRVLLGALALFLLGSLACGLAPSAGLLVAGRVLQGAGSGGLFVSVGASLGEMFTPREGAKYFGWFSICFAVASLAGPVVGGLLTGLTGWRSIFLVNLPLGLVAVALLKNLDLPRRRRDAPFDFAGVVLLGVTITGFTLLTPWSIPLGAAAAVTFVLVKRRVKAPVLPLRLFRDRTFSVSVVLSVLAGFAFLGSINYVAVFLQADAGPAEGGLRLVPMTIAVAVSSAVASRVIARTGHYRWAPRLSMALGLLAMLGLTTVHGLPLVLSCLVVFGLAAGLNLQVLAMATQNTAPAADRGAVAAGINLARALGSALGPVALGFAYGAGTHGVFLALLPVLALALVTAFALPHVPLRDHH
ncbi:MFS transporter [Amycolatopsis sp. WQ 127309]|uniref:MFS transporter n=1 Tax=Amycolatopsis sp. WQ 127309 TaxID=2932773 RepID=UPI001FF40AF1|nr:MFS transporter [Amycolatopsis sp. WQ 127309]UOZ09935.1 MFS transporter [Amycolatopsis sp. WQ 127309]